MKISKIAYCKIKMTKGKIKIIYIFYIFTIMYFIIYIWEKKSQQIQI